MMAALQIYNLMHAAYSCQRPSVTSRKLCIIADNVQAMLKLGGGSRRSCKRDSILLKQRCC